MKVIHLTIQIAIIAMLVIVPMFAQEPSPTPNPNAVEFAVACGSSSGTYEELLDELQPFLLDTVQFVKWSNTTPKSATSGPSSGAVENLDHLINNDVQGAFMHSDVIEFRRRAGKNMDKFKTLLTLHKEEVHWLVLTQSKRTTGHFWNSKPIELDTIEDLRGLRVGAAGGGYVTARTVQEMTKIPYEVIQFGTGKEVLTALNRGDIECAVFVGGAPLPNLKDLGPEYKLLSVPTDRIAQLSSVYSPASITYTKMRPEAVDTIAPDCLFIAQDYKTPRFRKAEKNIRDTFYQKLDEIKETRGTHPKWQEVDPTNHGKWPWLELQ